MRTTGSRLVGLALVISGISLPLSAQEPEKPLPPADRAPRLVLAHGGPHAPVRALAFSPDATTLYVAGFDKLVRRYELAKGEYKATGSFRVPLGPGNAGVVNALAVSPDGKWVAVAGRAPMRGESWAGSEDGIGEDFRRLPPLLRRDAGVVYLFNPAKPEAGRVIRGPESGVRALAFADPEPASGPVLVTAGIEWDANGELFGTVRVFDVAEGKEKAIARRTDLPKTTIPPGLVAWATGEKRDGLRVAVAWDSGSSKTGQLLLWDDPGTAREKSERVTVAPYNSPLAVRRDKDRAVTELLLGGYHVDAEVSKHAGLLTVRAPTGEEKSATKLPADANHLALPVGVAAAGDATAVLARVGKIAPPRIEWQRYELRLLGAPDAKPVPLDGLTNPEPVLTASPDGKFVAVAGFADNRVEVYDTTALAAGKPAVQKLTGDAGGFAQVAFLPGEKLWLGKSADEVAKGGVVLDLDRAVRAAGPGPKDAAKPDTPEGAEVLRLNAAQPARVTFGPAGAEKAIALSAGERITAAVFLPGKPAWDPALGPVVAVAHVHDRSQSVLVTLFDATTLKPLIQFGGPTLPVRALAFSGARALLAGAGDDGTVAVWALKNVTRKVPTIEGLLVSERDGAVVVAFVQPDSPAAGKLKAGDVIESVADAKGAQKPVKAPLDFTTVIRGLKVGDSTQIKAKGQPAVAVAVGTALGFRHPLFALWVDPRPDKDGKHDWVGWTSSGPYDANGETAEARIGWLTATGNPARPVTFAPAEQYRKLYYKRDFIRLLVEKADYNEALAALPRPPRPTLEVVLSRDTDLIDGLPVAREKIDSVSVALSDPGEVLDPDRLELRWQIAGPGGASEWTAEPFKAAHARLDLSKYPWKRGEYAVHLKLFKTGDAPADAVLAEEQTLVFGYVPPAPQLAVKIDNKVPESGAEIIVEKDEVEVAVDAKANPDGASVTVSWTGGGAPVELRRNAGDTFAPHTLKLKPGEGVTVMVTATNRGAGVKPLVESRTVTARVRRLAAKTVTPPAVKLLVLTPHDFRTATDQPYVVSTRKAVVTATVAGPDPVAEFEWNIDGKLEVGKLDAKTNSETRELDLPPDKPLAVRVRAKSKDSGDAFDTVEIRYDGLPEITLTQPPVVVTAPDLNLSGGLAVTGKRPFKVRVLVASRATGRWREFDATPDEKQPRWAAPLTLFPGTNELGYVVSYDDGRKELRRAGLAEVRYVRPPMIVGAAPLDVDTGTVGTLRLAVLSAPDAAPSEVWVNGVRVGFSASAKPGRVFGAAVWAVRAEGVAVPAGADRLKPVAVTVRTAEGASAPASVEVRGRAEGKVSPPAIRLSHAGRTIHPDRSPQAVDEQTFKFDLRVTSETRLTKVEVWHGGLGDGPAEPVRGIKLADAVPGPDGVVLAAAPELRLRPGAENRVRVVAANEGGSAEVAFLVSYTPPAVRVVLDTVRELKPNAAPLPVHGAAGLRVGSHVVEVEGHVEWDHDNDPVARDDGLAAVFVANGVAHLPVPLQKAQVGAKVRTFKGLVYLNALDPNPKALGVTNLRVELRSGGRPMAVPQSALSRARVAVESTAPLRKQRLHLLVLGVEVPEARRKQLIADVVAAVGGTVPPGVANFTEGRFDRKGFDFAYLYGPRLGYTKSGDLNALLYAVRTDIENRTKREGENWLNDVIVVYYQGADWVDEKGWFLHSATTLSGAAGKNMGDYAIRLDTLPQVPGLPVVVVNVKGEKFRGDNLAVVVSYLRTAWGDPASTVHLLPQLANAIQNARTFEDVVTRAGERLSTGTQKPIDWVPKFARDVLDRYVGLLQP